MAVQHGTLFFCANAPLAYFYTYFIFQLMFYIIFVGILPLFKPKKVELTYNTEDKILAVLI